MVIHSRDKTIRSDNLTPEQRRLCMSHNRGKNTSIENTIRSELHKRGYRFFKHAKNLPGKPDIVFPKKKVAIFIDGDYWHGYKFSAWKNKLSHFWQYKIAETRLRDKRNFRKLRRSGWKVIRIWQHEIKKNLEHSVQRIIKTVDDS